MASGLGHSYGGCHLDVFPWGRHTKRSISNIGYLLATETYALGSNETQVATGVAGTWILSLRLKYGMDCHNSQGLKKTLLSN